MHYKRKGFKNQSANDVLLEWKRKTPRTRQQMNDETVASIPNKSLNIIEGSKVDLYCTTVLETSYEKNRMCPTFYNSIPDEIKNVTYQLKNTRKKVENCSNRDLIKYYMNR